MGKNRFKQYEIYVIIGIIFFALILLFVLVQTPKKQISELKNLNTGKYNISGFVSDLKTTDKHTKFKLTDSTDTITVITFRKIKDINNGAKIEIVCDLETTKYGKQCVVNKVKKIS